MVTSSEKLNELFPDRLTLSPSEAAAAALGWSGSTARAKLCKKEFPLPLICIGGRKLVRISDLAKFIDEQPIVNCAEKAKPGRPTKREQAARRMAVEGA